MKRRQNLSFLVKNTNQLLQYFLIGAGIVLGILYIISQSNIISRGYLLQQTEESKRSLALELEEIERKIALQQTQRRVTKDPVIQHEFTNITRKEFLKIDPHSSETAKKDNPNIQTP